MRLTVLLASILDSAEYAVRYNNGAAPDRLPYGLEHLPDEIGLTLSRPSQNSRFPTKLRSWLMRVTGADLVHGFRNRKVILQADAVYAHTEREYLAAAAVLRVYRNRRTVLAGQTIWLYDGFQELPPLSRRIVHWLITRVDVLIYNSTANRDRGLVLEPELTHVYIPFGVGRLFDTVERKPADEPPFVLSVGIDRARDWPTLAKALAVVSRPLDIRVAARADIPEMPAGSVRPTADFTELLELYGRANCVVITVHPNLHASGITTILEAAAAGVPLICSDAGGLRDYFTDDEVVFVEPHDADALAAAIEDLLNDPAQRDARGAAVKRAFEQRDYDSQGHWRRVSDVLAPMLRG